MNKKKRIGIIALLVVGVTGLVIGLPAYNKSQRVAICQNVGSLNNPFIEGPMQSEGMVTNDQGQYIYVNEQQVISEVYVKQGDRVQVGDKLMAFDVSALDANLQMQYLELERYQKEAEALTQKLQSLKNTTPSQPEDEKTPPIEEGGVYHIISSLKDFKQESVEGRLVYTISCFEDAYVMGEVFNELVAATNAMMIFKVQDRTVWTVEAESLFSNYDPTLKISVVSRNEVKDDVVDVGMSAAEIQREIIATQQKIKENDINYRKAQVELKSLQESVQDGVVYASVDGIVRSVLEEPSSFEPFMSVTGNEGLYLTGAISEDMLDVIKVGDKLQASSWQTGEVYEAEIQSIDAYPSSQQEMYNWNNPNVTYYDFKAYIADAKNLKNGEYLSISTDTYQQSENLPLCLDSMYVREEQGRYYVMKDHKGKLKKQYVTVGKKLSGGYMIQVLDGIEETDYIAFPYGKNGVEGVKTKID